MPGLVVLVPPPCEPVSLAEAKLQLRVAVSNTAEDVRIRGALRAARIHCENVLRRVLVLQTLRATFDGFPGYAGYPWGAPRVLPNPQTDDQAIVLDQSPLQNVLSLVYIDETGATQTLDPSTYQVDGTNEPPRIMPAPGTLTTGGSWPSTRAQINGVTVTYQVGILIPFVANATANTLTVSTPAPENGRGVFVRAIADSGAAVPAGLVDGTLYFVVNSAGGGGNTFQLSATSGGAPIDLTTAGTGVQLLDPGIDNVRQAILMLAAHFFEQRGDGTQAVEVPPAVDMLLSIDRVWKF